MKERGFLPFTAVGLVLLLLAVGIAGYYRWDSHQENMGEIHHSADSSLLTSIVARNNDLKRIARESLYDALWKAGKEDDYFEIGESRESWVEELASVGLQEKLSALTGNRENHFIHSKFRLEDGRIEVDLRRAGNGYPLARVELPGGSSLDGNLPDNSLKIELPTENLGTLADARFFLLQDRMGKFGNRLGTVGTRWKYAEYALAYFQAWVTKGINLSKKRSKALFQLALASHETGNFGSADYRALIKDLTGFGGFKEMLGKFDSNVVVKPLKKDQIQELRGKIGETLSQVEKSSDELWRAVDEIEKLTKFRPENWFRKNQEKFSHLQEKVESFPTQYLEERFQEISDNFSSLYKFPDRQLEVSLQMIRESKNSMEKVRRNFQSALDMMRRLKKENPILRQLYENFTQKGEPPGIAVQIETGAKNVLKSLDLLEEKVQGIVEKVQDPETFTARFPDGFKSHFERGLEENRELASGVLSRALKASSRTFEDFEEDIAKHLENIDRVYGQMLEEASRQDEEPKPNWRKICKEYPQPGEDYKEDPIEKVVEKYVIRSGKGTIGGLRKVLGNAKSHFGLLESLSGRFEEERKKLQKFELDKDLRKRLKEKIDLQTPKNLTREEVYELSPPKPLKSDPGLSVYHELEIEEVQFNREDPAGWVHNSAPPTPIPLWFIGVTLYWAQWDVKIKLERPIVEEVFDYRNQTLPRPMFEGSKNFVHKPLPFRQEFDRSEFGFRLIVIGLRPFEISYGDPLPFP